HRLAIAGLGRAQEPGDLFRPRRRRAVSHEWGNCIEALRGPRAGPLARKGQEEPPMLQRLGLAAALFAAAALGGATTYTVTSTADSGAGTLRQAITDANANPGADTIAFNITGSGVHTIVLASGLPVVTSTVT